MRTLWRYQKQQFETINKRYFDGGKKDEEAKKGAPDKEDWQMSSGKAVADWAQKYLSSYVPGKEYPGQLTATTPAPGEASGQEWLMKYLNSPNTGENYQLAADEIKKTLTGGYDPATSPFYKATREGAMKENTDAIDRARRGSAARGGFFNDRALAEEGNIQTNTSNYLNQILGKMAENERGNRLNAVGGAMELEKYSQGAPLAKATAGMSLGSLPRLLEQGDLETRYKDFLRKQEELSGTIPAAQGVFQTSVNYAQQQQQASPFERIMGSVIPAAGTVLGSFYGPGGAWAGGQAGSAVSSYLTNPNAGMTLRG
jgi:hypothetical protein